MNLILNNLDWLAGGCELFGSWLVGSRRRLGFLVNMACCLTWVVVAFNREVYGLLLVVVPAFFINIRNYRRWRRQETPVVRDYTEWYNSPVRDVKDTFSKGVSG